MHSVVKVWIGKRSWTERKILWSGFVQYRFAIGYPTWSISDWQVGIWNYGNEKSVILRKKYEMTHTKDDSIPVFYLMRFRWKISDWRYRKTCSTLQHVGRHRSPFCLCPKFHNIFQRMTWRRRRPDTQIDKRGIILEEQSGQTSSGESVLWWVSDEKRRKDEIQDDVQKTHTDYKSMTRICAVTLSGHAQSIYITSYGDVLAEHHIYILIVLFFLIVSVVLLLILSIFILGAIIYSTRQIVHDQDSTIVDEIILCDIISN